MAIYERHQGPMPGTPGLASPAQEVSLPIGGMTCASCVRRVEKALARVPGVRDARVNLATERASVAYDPAMATLDQIAAAIATAGYAVRDVPEAAAPSPSV